MNIELTDLERENLAGWLHWFIQKGGTNVLFPDATELLVSVMNKLAD
jgi:hypothetical protein